MTFVDNGHKFTYLESDGKPLEAWAQVRGLIWLSFKGTTRLLCEK